MVLLSCFLIFVPTVLGDRWDLITTNVMVVFHQTLSIRGSRRPLSVFVYGLCTCKHILYIPVVFLCVNRAGDKAAETPYSSPGVNIKRMRLMIICFC